MPIDELTELMVECVVESFVGLDDFHLDLVRSWVRTQLDRLAALGVVALRDVQCISTDWGGTHAQGGAAELTPAGVPVAVRLAEELGITVLSRPDPATATARELVTLIERLQPDTWLADAGEWAAHRGAEPAAREIVGVLNDVATPAPVVLAALTQLDALVGEHAIPAITAMLGGPHDSFAVHLLMSAGALDPAERLEPLWRTEHPRVAELLEAIGEHHPHKRVAKAARKALLRHRSFIAGRQ